MLGGMVVFVLCCALLCFAVLCFAGWMVGWMVSCAVHKMKFIFTEKKFNFMFKIPILTLVFFIKKFRPWAFFFVFLDFFLFFFLFVFFVFFCLYFLKTVSGGLRRIVTALFFRLYYNPLTHNIPSVL